MPLRRIDEWKKDLPSVPRTRRTRRGLPVRLPMINDAVRAYRDRRVSAEQQYLDALRVTVKRKKVAAG